MKLLNSGLSFRKGFPYFIILAIALVVHSCSSDDNVFIVPGGDDDAGAYPYEIHFIDVGQGDAIYVVTPDRNLLVDGGWQSSGAREYLNEMEVDTIDIVIATHPHADHIGGLIDVFHSFVVGEVIDPGVTHTTMTYNNYMATIDFYDIPFTVGRKGMEWSLSENAGFRLLHPQNPSSDHLNNASVVALVSLGEITLLLTGDAEKEAEQEMLADAHLLAADILKVGHHGSWTSSTTAFLDAVQPEISVIMCGIDNDYGHPHGVALERLQASGTEIFRTDLNGSIVIFSDGQEYVISTEH